MLPEFINHADSPYGLLPPGVHFATINQIEERFCTNDHRKALFNGLKVLIDHLELAGCKAFYLDGSFVTKKELPEDYDGCWDPKGVNGSLLDSVLLNFDNKRAAQKLKFGGEVFPASWPATSLGDVSFLEFFQKDKQSGRAKGIVGIKLGDMQ